MPSLDDSVGNGIVVCLTPLDATVLSPPSVSLFSHCLTTHMSSDPPLPQHLLEAGQLWVEGFVVGLLSHY